MTFLRAALEILRREGRALHFKELTERAMGKKMLTFVGRTPEVTMQTQLTAAVKKAPGNPFVRVKPGVFGLLRYPELTAEEREAIARAEQAEVEAARKGPPGRSAPAAGGEASKAEGEGGRRRRRRGRGGRGRGEATETTAAAPGTAPAEVDDETEEPAHGGLSAEARAAALAETGVLEGDDETGGDHDDEVSMEDDEKAAARVAGAAEDEEMPIAAGPVDEPGVEDEGEEGDEDEDEGAG